MTRVFTMNAAFKQNAKDTMYIPAYKTGTIR